MWRGWNCDSKVKKIIISVLISGINVLVHPKVVRWMTMIDEVDGKEEKADNHSKNVIALHFIRSIPITNSMTYGNRNVIVAFLKFSNHLYPMLTQYSFSCLFLKIHSNKCLSIGLFSIGHSILFIKHCCWSPQSLLLYYEDGINHEVLNLQCPEYLP